jgi:hypothetical protein
MGVVSMSQMKSENETVNPDECELIVAYLSYAIEDVRAVSDIGLHLLQMTIAALRKQATAANSDQDAPVISCH